MKLKKEIGLATLANWGGTFSSYLIAFFATPIIVLSFGNVRYGIWSLAMSLTAYYGMLDFGISTTIIKFFSEYREKEDTKLLNQVVNGALFLYLCIAVILLLIIGLVVINVEHIFNVPDDLLHETKVLFIITGFTFIIELIGNTFRSVVISMRKFGLKNAIQTTFTILRTISIIFFLKSGYGLIIAGLSVLFIDLVRNMVYLGFAYKHCPFLKLSVRQVDLSFLKTKASFTFYNLLRKISIRIIERSDLILVGIFFDMKAVALFSIGESLCRYIQMIPKGLRATILPFSSSLNARDQKDDLKKMGYFLPKYIFSFFMGTLLMAILFGQEFLDLWMGPGYEVSYGIVVLLLISKTFFMTQSILVHMLTGMGYNKYFGILGVAEVCCKIIFSIFFLKLFGLHGIAVGSLATFFITSLIFVPYYALEIINISKFKYYINVMVKPALLCLLIGGINYWMDLNIFWSPVVALEYVVLFFWFVWKEVRIKDNRLVWQFNV